MRKRKKLLRLQKLQRAFGSLIALVAINAILLYVKFVIIQDFTVSGLIINFVAIISILLGYYLGLGVSIVASFVFVIVNLAWLTTFELEANFLDYTRLLLIPSMTILSGYINLLQKETYLVYKHLNRNNQLLQIDEQTGLPNIEKLKQDIIKQNIIRKENKHYNYGLMMIKICFIDFLKSQMGAFKYDKMINQLVRNYQLFLGFQDEMFWVNDDSIVVLFPLGKYRKIKDAERQIKDFTYNLEFKDKKERTMVIDIQTSILLQQDIDKYFELSDTIEGLVLKLTRKVEEDIISEYTR